MIFQDFLGSAIFKKNIQYFPGGVGTLLDPTTPERRLPCGEDVWSMEGVVTGDTGAETVIGDDGV